MIPPLIESEDSRTTAFGSEAISVKTLVNLGNLCCLVGHQCVLAGVLAITSFIFLANLRS